jgi:biotin operon repressor
MKDGSAWAQGIFQQAIATHADALRARGLTLPGEGAKPNAP